VTGLRIDHVDGLFAPGDYLRRLQARAGAALGRTDDDPMPLYVVVEKILGPEERLLGDWPVHGTTGYEFAAMVNGLFVDRRHQGTFDRLYERIVVDRRRLSFDDLVYACKKRVMHETMSGDINSLGYRLNHFSERNRHFRDFTLYSLIATIKEVIACFPVYRTYITDEGPLTDHDRRYVTWAIRSAKRASPVAASLVFDFIERILLHETATADTSESEERQRFIGKFQQTTSPVAAKGIEDTALYIYNRLVSLNEVGASPTIFGHEPGAVHAWMAERRRQWPAALSATSTHDTKRGEDTRVRIDAISELPEEWKRALTKWRSISRRWKADVAGRHAPDANEEYFLYQAMVGAWPLEPDEEAAFPARLKAYMTKALREAKVNTSWLTPDEEYEQAVLAFIDHLLDPDRPFLEAFRPFQRRAAEIGIVNGLAQLVIKCTAPGVPDFYQRTELWDLSLVDPDNRRQVDYERRARILDELRTVMPSPAVVSSLFESRADGRVKMYTMIRALAVRRSMPDVFAAGGYVPLTCTGTEAEHAFAFARIHAGGIAVACVPRLVASLPGRCLTPPIGADCWNDTSIRLPAAAPVGGGLVDAFTGARIEPSSSAEGEHVIKVADLLAHFPVALASSRPRPDAEGR
jgi:(1->4)-alpha-D-glucan 1-alpha-D-glucosylmutase